MSELRGQDESRSELIDDHEVESAGQDQLGHKEIADQIVRLIQEVRTPTNVALYGPWGSGKSGIANLVRAAIDSPTKGKKQRFVRFDAFKFAETPLRRNFINAVATELEIDDEKYHADLYAGITKTDFTLPAAKIGSVIKTFALALGAVCILLVGLAAALAAVQKGSWHGNFTTNSRTFLVASFPFAALLTGIVGLATKAFGAERKTDRADSDEQFEALFRDLVSKSKTDRLVVFVDEIDRCAPHEVVSTLDVIRTFLGVEKCVFIVAADQQVLESALSTSVRQNTPNDSINPYYSTGSAYLDKVFQYQVTVPPLPDQSITHYAAQLVQNRNGVWASIDRDTVVSVLIPSHVRSPRRVKHLLNAFVLAHRVAIARQAAGLLDAWDASRVLELAKLVCLQIEFPLFTRSMVEVPRLPEYVQAANDNPKDWREAYPYMRERDADLAIEYANQTRAVDQTLSDPEGEDDKDGATGAQATQLLEYLSRTASIQGPQRDLIYMQGLGAPFGLPSELADRVTEASQNGRVTGVQAELNESNEPAVFELLAQQLRTAVGIEQRNVAAVVLRLMSSDRPVISVAADSLVTTLAPALTRFPDLVDTRGLPGLWRLTGASSLPESERLAHLVMSSDVVLDNADAAITVLSDSERAITVDQKAVDDLVCHFVSSEAAESFVDQLTTLSIVDTKRLIDASVGLPDKLKQVWTEGAAATERLKAGATTPPVPAGAATPAPGTADDEVEDEAAQLQAATTTKALNAWIQTFVNEDDKSGAQSVIAAVLGADHIEARNVAEPYLESAGVWVDEVGTDRILRSAQRRIVSLTPKWLSPVNPAVASPDVLVESLSYIAKQLWEQDVPGVGATEVANALGRVLRGSPNDVQTNVEDLVLANIDSPVEDEDEAEARLLQLQRAQILLGGGVVRPPAVQAMESRNLAQTLELELAALTDDASMVQYVEASLKEILQSWGNENDLPVPTELYDALQASTWLPDVLAVKSRLALQKRTGQIESEPSLATVLALIDQHPEEAVALAAGWLQARDSTAEEAVNLIEKLKTYNLWTDTEFLQAVQAWRISLSNERLKETWEKMLVGRFTLPSALGSALGFDTLREDDAVAVLISRMADANNNSERKEVLELASSRRFNSRAARKRYVNGLVIPLFSAGVQATSEALDAIKRLGKPFPGESRTLLLASIRSAIKDNDQLTKKATEILVGLGFSTKGKGPFGLGGKQLKFD